MQNKISKNRSLDLGTSPDPFNGPCPGPNSSFQKSADDVRDKERDREQGYDCGDDGDNNDFSLIGDEDFLLQVRNPSRLFVPFCTVLYFLVPTCPVPVALVVLL